MSIEIQHQSTISTQNYNQKITPNLYTCSSCKIQKNTMQRCGKCKKVYYCNINCQKKDFLEHKKICVPPKQQINIKNNQQQMGIDEFTNLEHIGSGNFSQIFKGISKKDKKLYAIKQIDKAKLKRLEKQADVFMEKHCLQKLKGFQYSVQIQKTFQDQISLYIQMECPEKGQLWNQCKTFGLISQKIVKYYFSHIVYAIQKLQNQYSIVHRDLKPQNILLTSDHKIKLIDFGTAKDVSRPDIKGSGNGSKRRKVFENFIGTPNYMAPQCIHNKASQKCSDIYSLGGLFYFLKTGNPPFTGGSQYLIFNKSLNNQVYLPESIFDSTEKDMVLKMMQKDMAKRINIDDLMKHEYFKDIDFKNLEKYEDIMKKLTKEQLFLIQFKMQIQEYVKYYSQPIEIRLQIYQSKIKPLIKQKLQGLSKQLDANCIKERMKQIQISIYVMLNLYNDTNQGFQQIHKKLNETI